jgi:hypothetical protein
MALCPAEDPESRSMRKTVEENILLRMSSRSTAVLNARARRDKICSVFEGE